MNSKTEEIGPDAIAAVMREQAMTGIFRGQMQDRMQRMYLLNRCRRVVDGATVIFSRDAGHHTSGWFKNPDYERCWHLSLSPAPRAIWTPDTPDFDKTLTLRWVRAFFRDDADKLWAESPKTPEGKAAGVVHWRLFADESWAAIVPRGEVYSRELTEIGWKTASEMGIEILSPLVPG